MLFNTALVCQSRVVNHLHEHKWLVHVLYLCHTIANFLHLVILCLNVSLNGIVFIGHVIVGYGVGDQNCHKVVHCFLEAQCIIVFLAVLVIVVTVVYYAV